MKAYGEVNLQVHIFLTSAQVGGKRSASRPGRFAPGIQWIGGWVGPRAGVDDVERRKFLVLPSFETRTLDRPAPYLVAIPTERAIPAPGRRK
jgi:hypothetical protein